MHGMPPQCLTFPRVNHQLVVDVQSGRVIGPHIQGESLAGGGQQFALPPSGHVVRPVRGDRAGPPSKVDLHRVYFVGTAFGRPMRLG